MIRGRKRGSDFHRTSQTDPIESSRGSRGRRRKETRLVQPDFELPSFMKTSEMNCERNVPRMKT